MRDYHVARLEVGWGMGSETADSTFVTMRVKGDGTMTRASLWERFMVPPHLLIDYGWGYQPRDLMWDDIQRGEVTQKEVTVYEYEKGHRIRAYAFKWLVLLTVITGIVAYAAGYWRCK